MNYKRGTIAFIALILVGVAIAKSSNDSNPLDNVPKEIVVKPEVEETFESKALSLYEALECNSFSAPNEEVFAKALKGYYKMEEEGRLKNRKLTIIDFSKSSTEKRLWVIDMDDNKILLESVVAHGRKTGDEYAVQFSNTIDSHMSSLGFYKTGETYIGSNGFSMRLDGLEKGINDNARVRAIVVHGANYASEKLGIQQGRLGRSYGCPAVPVEINKELIELIKDESCLFIYATKQDYLNRSEYLI